MPTKWTRAKQNLAFISVIIPLLFLDHHYWEERLAESNNPRWARTQRLREEIAGREAYPSGAVLISLRCRVNKGWGLLSLAASGCGSCNTACWSLKIHFDGCFPSLAVRSASGRGGGGSEGFRGSSVRAKYRVAQTCNLNSHAGQQRLAHDMQTSRLAICPTALVQTKLIMLRFGEVYEVVKVTNNRW